MGSKNKIAARLLGLALGLLLAALPATAQNSDPFRSAPPPEPMLRVPPPAPKPRPAPAPEPQPEPAVVVPPTPPPPQQKAAPPIASFDGDYVGALKLVDNPNMSRFCDILDTRREMKISNGNFVFIYQGNRKAGNVQGDGSIDAIFSGLHLIAKVKNQTITGKTSSSICGYSSKLQKQ